MRGVGHIQEARQSAAEVTPTHRGPTTNACQFMSQIMIIMLGVPTPRPQQRQDTKGARSSSLGGSPADGRGSAPALREPPVQGRGNSPCLGGFSSLMKEDASCTHGETRHWWKRIVSHMAKRDCTSVRKTQRTETMSRNKITPSHQI